MGLWLLTAASLGAAVALSPLVRESRAVTVLGARETWRLEWKSAPKPSCDDEPDGLVTCPCQGFAVGEQGELFLVRLRPGKPEQRLALAPLFEGRDEPAAVLRRYDAEAWYAAGEAGREKLPSLPVMKISAYGPATAGFVLQTGSWSCGHQPSVLVGVSRQRDEPHAVGTAEHPDQPVVLERQASWQELREKGRVESIETACGDHGSELEHVVSLRADAAGLHGSWADYACEVDGKRGALLERGTLGGQPLNR